jgi:exodeoxyribonuclease-5
VGDDVHVMADPMFKLETIHRHSGEIAHFAEHLRKGKAPRKFHGGGERVRLVDPGDLADDLLAGVDQVICAFNRTRVAMNRRVRRLLGRRAPLEKGDRIICLRNDRRAELFNGMQGVVAKVLAKRALLSFVADDGAAYQDVRYDPAAFNQEKPAFEFGPGTPHPFDYGYCVTCHKGQGSEWKEILVLEERCDRWDPARWAYTAATRAKKRLIWAGSAPT